jgi:hypothetical protein
MWFDFSLPGSKEANHEIYKGGKPPPAEEDTVSGRLNLRVRISQTIKPKESAKLARQLEKGERKVARQIQRRKLG